MANKDIVQETFPVLGMSCASCSARVEKTLNHQPGVRKAVVNYASAMATVEYDLQNCSPETLHTGKAITVDFSLHRQGFMHLIFRFAGGQQIPSGAHFAKGRWAAAMMLPPSTAQPMV